MPKKDKSTDEIYEAIGSLAKMFSYQFQQMSERFEQVDKRFEQIDKLFDSMDGSLQKFENTLAQHTVQLKDLQQSNSQIITRLDSIEGRLLSLENDIKRNIRTNVQRKIWAQDFEK